MSSSSLSKTLYRYGRDPVSMTLLVCVIVSAVITFLSLAFLLGYIILQGIPNINLDLFAFEYNTENVFTFPCFGRYSYHGAAGSGNSHAAGHLCSNLPC